MKLIVGIIFLLCSLNSFAVEGQVNSTLESMGSIDFTGINGIDACNSFSSYSGVSCSSLGVDKIAVQVPIELKIDNTGGSSSFVIDLILTKGSFNYDVLKFEDGAIKSDTFTLNQVGAGVTVKSINLYFEMYTAGVNAVNNFSSLINVELRIQ